MAQVVFGAADGVQSSEPGEELGVAQVEVFVVGVEADGVGQVLEGFVVIDSRLAGEGVEAVEEALAQVFAVDLGPLRGAAVQQGAGVQGGGAAAGREATGLVGGIVGLGEGGAQVGEVAADELLVELPPGTGGEEGDGRAAAPGRPRR